MTSTTIDMKDERRHERGAALISVLLIATLLLSAGGMLILSSTMTATNAVDATAELHAYYGAEAGLQAALNVLEGNGPASSPAATFRNAVSNPTLSPWLSYNSAATPVVPVGANAAFRLSVTDPDITPITEEPKRLLVDVTGYGPKGAQKKMRMIVKGLAFDVTAPTTIVIRGADDGTAMTRFEIGSSNSKKYSGEDKSGAESQKPTIGVSLQDVTTAQNAITKGSTVANPQIGVLDLYTPPATIPSVITPWFLKTADAARSFVADAEILAESRGRLYSSFNGFAGSDTNPELTFVKGTCQLDGGAGLLIVTGELITKGNPNFKGIVLVLGEGRVTRSGGGNGEFNGVMMIAKFNSTGEFLAPYFDVDGGGNSNFQYDSDAVRKALNSPGRRVLGVVER